MKGMRCFLLLSVLIISSIEINAWNIKHEYTDTYGKTMGKNRVYRNGDEVFIEEFHYAVGVYGINKPYYSLDIDAFDNYVFYVCQHTNYPYIYITIQWKSSTDSYGNKIPGEKITIGKIDTKESKKYKDVNHWAYQYGFITMFSKYREAYGN